MIGDYLRSYISGFDDHVKVTISGNFYFIFQKKNKLICYQIFPKNDCIIYSSLIKNTSKTLVNNTLEGYIELNFLLFISFLPTQVEISHYNKVLLNKEKIEELKSKAELPNITRGFDDYFYAIVPDRHITSIDLNSNTSNILNNWIEPLSASKQSNDKIKINLRFSDMDLDSVTKIFESKKEHFRHLFSTFELDINNMQVIEESESISTLIIEIIENSDHSIEYFREPSTLKLIAWTFQFTHPN